MLKYYIIAAFVMTITGALHGSSLYEDPGRLERVLKSFITRRCIANSGSEALDDLKNSTEQFGECVWDVLFKPRRTEGNDEVYLICTDVRTALQSCISPFLDNLEPCLDKAEKYFPNSVSKLFNRTFDEHCKDGGETFTEHVKTFQDFPCTSLKKKPESALEECFLKTSALEDLETSGFVVTEENLCGYLKDTKTCFFDYLQKNCNEKAYELYEVHVRSIKEWCGKYLNETDN